MIVPHGEMPMNSTRDVTNLEYIHSMLISSVPGSILQPIGLRVTQTVHTAAAHQQKACQAETSSSSVCRTCWNPPEAKTNSTDGPAMATRSPSTSTSWSQLSTNMSSCEWYNLWYYMHEQALHHILFSTPTLCESYLLLYLYLRIPTRTGQLLRQPGPTQHLLGKQLLNRTAHLGTHKWEWSAWQIKNGERWTNWRRGRSLVSKERNLLYSDGWMRV